MEILFWFVLKESFLFGRERRDLAMRTLPQFGLLQVKRKNELARPGSLKEEREASGELKEERQAMWRTEKDEGDTHAAGRGPRSV